jgi:hypothetical protein
MVRTLESEKLHRYIHCYVTASYNMNKHNSRMLRAAFSPHSTTKYIKRANETQTQNQE